MKRLSQSVGRTNRKRNETGSIALEASLVMPIVLMVIIFLISLIRLASVQMALHGSASQTVRQAAANFRPIELAYEQLAPHLAAMGELPTLQPLPGINGVADKLEHWLPAPSGPLMAAVLRGDWKPVQNAAATEIGRSVIEPMLRHEADKEILDPSQLRLSNLSLPKLKDNAEPYIRIEAEYTFKLGFPFTKRSIVLREQAEERIWVSDAVPAMRGEGNPDLSHANIQIVSIEPEPLRPGRRARLIVLTDPGRSLDLAVDYKSGRSKAKHLGKAAADTNGRVEWTWLVSGNTTPGVWELIVTADDGTKVARHFVVEKQPGAP
jgi:hypothetical protein